MPEPFVELTRSICPECRRIIDARIVLRDDGVYMRKRCPEHGQYEVLVYADATAYTRSAGFNMPGTIPLAFNHPVEAGCPYDSGLCPEHQRHACLGIIEVNSACNRDCPLCFAIPGKGFTLTLAEVEEILDDLERTEGRPEVVQFSGAEPSIHPQRPGGGWWWARTASSGREAAVTELTEFRDLPTWPAGTRLIVRREPRHPGAQRSPFRSLEFRFWGFYTDRQGDPVELDRFMRAHAHVEDCSNRLQDSGLERFPFSLFDADSAWLAGVGLAADLVHWFQLLCLRGELRQAKPKALRWRLGHAPARLVSSGRRTLLRLLDSWPDAHALLDAHRRIALLT